MTWVLVGFAGISLYPSVIEKGCDDASFVVQVEKVPFPLAAFLMLLSFTKVSDFPKCSALQEMAVECQE